MGDRLKRITTAAILLSVLVFFQPAVAAFTFIDDDRDDFDSGSYENTIFDETVGAVRLASGTTQGHYTSSVKDAGGLAAWDNLSWIEALPYGEELPDGGGSDAGADMSGNLLLLHLNENDAVIADSSGLGNHGTNSGGALVEGRFLRALYFEGDAYVEIPNVLPEEGTIEFWFMPDWNGGDGAGYTLFDASHKGKYFFIDKDSNNRLRWWIEDESDRDMQLSVDGSFLEAGRWYHIAVTWRYNSSGPHEIFVNGTKLGSMTYALAGKPELRPHPRIGNYTYSYIASKSAASARIDEFAIYDRVLSDQEIRDHYLRGALSLNFQVRTSSDNASWGEFVGPDGTPNTFFENADASVLENVGENRYFQYRAYFRTEDPDFSPELKGVQVSGATLTDFAVEVSPAELVLIRTETAAATISVSLVAGDIDEVRLTTEWVGTPPSDVAVELDAENGAPPFESSLTLVAGKNATLGDFTLRVIGEGENLTRTFDVNVRILTFEFSLAVDNEEMLLTRSDSKNTTLSIELLSGTAGKVVLRGSWVGPAPEGLSATLSPASGTPPFNSTLYFQTTSTAVEGVFTFRVVAEGGGEQKAVEITVEVRTRLEISLTTDNAVYEKGQTITVSGSVRDPLGRPVDGTAKLQYLYLHEDEEENWTVTRNIEVTNGEFRDNYRVSHGDPEGVWSVSVLVVDRAGNTGSAAASFEVLTPAATAYYTVKFTSPLAGDHIRRGESVLVAVEVTEGGDPVEGADVYLVAPSGARVKLAEVGGGLYSVEFVPSWDEPIGQWSVSVESVKENKTGGAWLNVWLEPAKLSVELESPKERRLEVGEEVTFEVRVVYPDGTPVEDAFVTVRTPTENLTLTLQGAGLYSGKYIVREEDTGSWTLSVSASDLYGNSGTVQRVFSVEAPAVPSMLARYWWAILASLVGVGGGIAVAWHKTGTARKLARLRRERREILRLMREAERRYYRDGSITRDTFDELMKGYEIRLAELEKEESTLKRGKRG